MEETSDSGEGTPVLRVKHVSRRMTVRESFSEPDRQVSAGGGPNCVSHLFPHQLKKLFRAIQDGDANYVRYLFGWEEGVANIEKLCHPLCQCERCSQLRKVRPQIVLCAGTLHNIVFVGSGFLEVPLLYRSH